MKDWLDFSSFEITHPVFNVWREDLPSEKLVKDELLSLRHTTRNELGRYKDELNLMATKNDPNAFSHCSEIIALRPKCYGMSVVSSNRDVSAPDSAHVSDPAPTPIPDHSICRAKGIKRSLITDKVITLANYRQTLKTRHPQRHAMTSIQSHNHTVYIETLHKVSMSLFENKRSFFNKFHSDPYHLPPSLHTPLMWPENVELENEAQAQPNSVS